MLPHFLQLGDGVTRQRTTLRVDPEELPTVGASLELFKEEAARLVDDGWLLQGSVPAFHEVGECLFRLDAEGRLEALHDGLRVLRGHEPLELGEPLRFERREVEGRGDVMLAELTLDRRDCTYQRDWAAYHRRKWAQGREAFERLVIEAAAGDLGVETAARALQGGSEQDRGLLLRAAARRVHEAPFELYSRFLADGRLIKDGAATLRAIAEGHGGACSEKAQAVKLLADGLGLEAEYVLSGPGASGEVPEEALLEILDTFDVQYSRAVQRYWNHLAVLVRIAGEEVLVDASGGNIPFLWERGERLAALLDARGSERVAVRHKYVVEEDELYYNRVDQLVPERLLYALELGWADPHIDLVQVLDDELGLLGGRGLWLGVIPYRDEEERATVEAWYEEHWLAPGKVRGLAFAEELEASREPLCASFVEAYPAAAQGAAEGLPAIEARLEEANPGEGYRVELVVAARIDPEEETP